MSFKKISSNGPPPELVESDQKDDDEPDLLTTDTSDIEYDFTRTGQILFMIYGDLSPNVGGDNTSYKKKEEAGTFYMTFSVKTKTGHMLGPQ